uniref:Uncharacterized protein n=2 Tax=Schistocephalus solidus TaxID=70667 RepID=A0A0X3PF97_SCHSO
MRSGSRSVIKQRGCSGPNSVRVLRSCTSCDYMHVRTRGYLVLTNRVCLNPPIKLKADSCMASPLPQSWEVAPAVPDVPSSGCQLLPSPSPIVPYRIRYPPSWPLTYSLLIRKVVAATVYLLT